MNLLIKEYLEKQKIKAVKTTDFQNNKIEYSKEIKGWKMSKLREDNKSREEISEEMVRAYVLTKLANELGYDLKNIEIEKKYSIGRKPKGEKGARIDIIVRDNHGNAFLYIELKTPREYDKNQDEIIENQLFKLASQEVGEGKRVKYLVLYSLEIFEETIKDKCILIDYEKFNSFEMWREIRNFADELPKDYEQARKEPYVKGGKKDLEKKFTPDQFDGIRKNLHNVLWGGGGTDDNDIFSSLVNIILAKIQDESETKNGEEYDFQVFSYKNGEDFETNEKLFDRINKLYRKALKKKLNLTDEQKLKQNFVVDTNKFSLGKLKHTVSELERFSFIDGKSSFYGKDILGDFFEGIVREGFKQTKGQFFTHINIVRFLLWGLQLDKLAIEKVNNEQKLPYLIDPAAGSGTFLVEYMKFITENLKRRFKNKLGDSKEIEDKFQEWFLPDDKENRWARNFIYGIEINFNLGTATKVNMILHGDGSTNIFVEDGLLPFRYYDKETEPNFLKNYEKDRNYFNKEINGKFEIVVSNPPFSVNLDNETKRHLKDEFIFGDKRNSENLFIERWYQLLKPNGRLGVVLPESVFDTTENKHIRLFLYKNFEIKAIISLPQLTFQPFTSTKTSLLFARKKTKKEIEGWDKLWNEYSKEWNHLKTRCENLLKVYLKSEERRKFPSIKNLDENEEKEILVRMLKNYLEESDKKLSGEEIVKKYQKELSELSKYDNDTKDYFGLVNTWWVFGEVAEKLNYQIFLAEIENIGYKRTKRSEKITINELFRTDNQNKVLLVEEDGIMKTALDYLRKKTEWNNK